MIAKLNSTQKKKLYILSVLLLPVIYIFISNLRTHTYTTPGTYWSYQGHLLASEIIETGKITELSFSTESRATGWANQFKSEFGSPLFLVTTVLISGESLQFVELLGIIAIPALISQFFIAKHFFEYKFLPLVALFTIFTQFPQLTQLIISGRTRFGFTIFLFLVFTLLKIKKEPRFIYISLILMASLLFMFKTLAFAGTWLLIVIVATGYLMDNKIIEPTPVILLLVAVVLYQVFINTWGVELVSKFAFNIAATEFLSINPLKVLSSGRLTVNELLVPWIKNSYSAPDYYDVAKLIVIITALLLTMLAGITVLFRSIFSRSSILDSETFIWGFSAFLPFMLITRFIFAASSAARPGTWILLILPVTATYISIKIFHSDISWSNVILAVVIICLVVSGGYTMWQVPATERSQLTMTDEAEYAQLHWNKEYNKKNTIASDFAALANYYSIGGNSNSYLPLPRSPAYASNTTSQWLLNDYYIEPEKVSIPKNYNREVQNNAQSYMIQERMENVGLVHIGSIITKPSNIDEKLSTSYDWNKVYSNGNNSDYVSI